MADNYIEKKMESMRTGRTVFRRDNPSLDTLLRRIAEQDGTTVTQPGAADALHTVKQAQIEAVLRSARLMGFEFEAVADEGRQVLDIKMHGSTSEECERLGGIIAVARLKAAELGLRTTVETSYGEGGASATIHLRK